MSPPPKRVTPPHHQSKPATDIQKIADLVGEGNDAGARVEQRQTRLRVAAPAAAACVYFMVFGGGSWGMGVGSSDWLIDCKATYANSGAFLVVGGVHERKTDRQTDRLTDRDRQTDRQTDRHHVLVCLGSVDRSTGACKQTNKQTNKHAVTSASIHSRTGRVGEEGAPEEAQHQVVGVVEEERALVLGDLGEVAGVEDADLLGFLLLCGWWWWWWWW